MVKQPPLLSRQIPGGQTPKPNENNNWGSASIFQMLQNQAYIGNMVQGKRQVVSFKTKKRRAIDPENWIVVEGTHEPIIDRELWDRVQKRIEGGHYVKRRLVDNELSLFAGVLRCADCGSIMAASSTHANGQTTGRDRCTRYVNNGKTACSIHFVKEDTLSAFVLNDIRLHAQLANAERERITAQLVNCMNQSQGREVHALEREMREAQNRLLTIASNLKSLYEDKCLGKLTDSAFQSLMAGFTSEQSTLEQKLEGLREQFNNRDCTENEIGKWLQLISQYMEITELDRPTVMELVDSITISEASRESGKRTQEITIQYRFIGNLAGSAKEDIA